MKVLVTGANGFVGQVLCARLREAGHAVVEAVRTQHASAPGRVAVGDIDGTTDWQPVLDGVEAVIHLAARVHQMGGADASAEAEFQRVNVAGSERLARQAVTAGVRRLVFVSSIKVNGEQTRGRAFTPEDAPAPEDAYGRSKLAAEKVLAQVSAESGLELVIVRPPMVVGPIARGNLPLLLKALWCRLPMPLACVHNRRSLVSVRNLAQVLMRCMEVPAAAGEVFLAADRPALESAQLVRYLGEGLQRRVCLLPVPVGLLRLGAALLGRQAQIDRLTQDLEVDAEKLKRVLGWTGGDSIEDALREAGREFAAVRQRRNACK